MARQEETQVEATEEELAAEQEVFGEEPEAQPEAVPAQPAATPGRGQPAPQAPDWSTQALPQGHPGLGKGFKTWGDLDKSYSSSSQEARRLAGHNEKLTEHLSKVVQAIQSRDAELAKLRALQAPAGQDFMPGFKTQAEWNLAVQQDRGGALRKFLASSMSDPEVQKSIQPMIDRQLQPLREAEEKALIQAQAQDVYARYPDFKPGTPLHQTAVNWIEQRPELAEAIAALPLSEGVNRSEIAFKLATFDILAEQLKGSLAKQGVARTKAATVQPATGARARPKTESPEDVVNALAAEHGVDGDAVNEALQFLKENVG